MVKISVVLFVLYIILVVFSEIVELRLLRDDNSLLSEWSNTKPYNNQYKDQRFSNDVNSLKIKDLNKANAIIKFLMNSIQKYEEILTRRPTVINQIFFNRLRNQNSKNLKQDLIKDDTNNLTDLNNETLLISSKQNTSKENNCLTSLKGCIFNDTKIKKPLKEKFKDVKLINNQKEFPNHNILKPKAVKPSTKYINNLNNNSITGYKNKNNRIFLNNPELKLVKNNQKHNPINTSDSSSRKDSTKYFKSIIFDKTKAYPDKLFENPVAGVEDVKYKNLDKNHVKDWIKYFSTSDDKYHNALRKMLKNSLEPTFHSILETHRYGQNFEVIHDENGENLIFELKKPFKLVKTEKDSHIINNEFVDDKTSNIYFHPFIVPTRFNIVPIVIKDIDDKASKSLNLNMTKVRQSDPVPKNNIIDPSNKSVSVQNAETFSSYNLELMILKKEFEKLKKNVFEITEDSKLKSNHKANKNPKTNDLQNKGNKSEHKVSTQIETTTLPVVEELTVPISFPIAEPPKTDEEPNKYSKVMKKVVELDRKGEAKELDKFKSANTTNDVHEYPLEPLVESIDNDTAESVDEGEILDNYSKLEMINSTTPKINEHKEEKNFTVAETTEEPIDLTNTKDHMSDFDPSIEEFSKQKSEDVNEILKVSPPSYSYKSVNVPE